MKASLPLPTICLGSKFLTRHIGECSLLSHLVVQVLHLVVFSRQGRIFRIFILNLMAIILVLSIHHGNGAIGWGLTPLAGVTAFATGLGYWL